MISDTMPTVALCKLLCQYKKKSGKCEKSTEPREDWRKNLVKVKKVKSVFKPIGPFQPKLIPVSEYQVLVHRMVAPLSISSGFPDYSPVPVYTPGLREALGE